MMAGNPLMARILAFALLALVAAALWLGPARAYLGFVAAGDRQLAEHAQLLQRYRALARLPATAAPAANPAATTLLLPPLPEAQAIALLQESVKRTAAQSRVEVRSLQVLRSEAAGAVQRIGVRINAAGDIDSLGHMLFAVETARPVLYPDNLHIQARPAGPGKDAQLLDFQLDLSGFEPRGGP